MTAFKNVLLIVFSVLLTSCYNGIDYVVHGGGDDTDPEIVYIVIEPEVDVWVDSFIQVAAYEDIDILWVIDGSCSMIYHQTNLLNGIDHMMNNLPSDVNWRLKMITAGDGTRITQPNTFPLTRGDTITEALTMYNLLPYDGGEAGFAAVQDYMTYDVYGKTWMRYDAAILVVFVSDEREQSTITSAIFSMWYGSQRPAAYLAFIGHVEAADSICANVPNSNMTGAKYIEAVNNFGGNVVDICEEDWSSGVDEATQKVRPIEEYELEHIPYTDTLVVFENGIPMEKSFWHYDSSVNIVYFDILPIEYALIEMVYSVKYYQLSP